MLKVQNYINSNYSKMNFCDDGFEVVKDAVNAQTLELLKIQFRMMKDNSDFAEDCSLGDGQVPNSFGWYGAYCFESLMLLLQKDVEKIIQKKLLPCYSYARIMQKGAIMEKHKDRPSCEYSATICISQDKKYPYPIFIEDYSGKVHEIVLQPGSMLVYNGTELSHWREKYKGKEHIQAFIHFVNSRGKYKDFKFDKRPRLGLGSEMREI